MKNCKWYLIVLVGLIALLIGSVGACGPAPSSTPPVIVEFTATPAEIDTGESATLHWNVSGATALSIDQGIGAVPAAETKEVSPATTAAYTLTASNSAGTVTKAVVVTVSAAPPPTPEAEPPTSEPEPPRKMTLDDAPVVLNMSLDLPARFERVDAASEGLSNEDLGLGSEFSEVQLFLSEEPFQMVYGFLLITGSRIEQAGVDAIMRDEEQVKSVILAGLEEGAAEENVPLSDVETRITYPDIADLCVLGEGSFKSSGFNFGFDYLMFKNGNVYVFVASLYMGEGSPLVPVARGINERIQTLR